MDRAYQRLRGIQQTIPGMMQKRGDGRTNFTNSISPMTSGVGNSGVYCPPQHSGNTPRMTPYKVPFQRRQLAEPMYADSAPVMIPQPLQLSSPYGLGTIYGGPTRLFIPTYQQNVMEPPHVDDDNIMCFQEETAPMNQQEAFVTGLTSSPPNHPIPHETVVKVQEVYTSVRKVKENMQNSKSELLEPKHSCFKDNQNENKKETKITNAAFKPFDPSRISMRVVTGSIEKIMKWEKMCENKIERPKFLFEIIAPLLQLKAGSKTTEKQILLREPGGPVLTVLFYEIDRIAPQLTVGDNVRCVCQPLGKRRYQAFSVRSASPKELSCLERLSFLSHRAVQEALLSTPEP